MLRANDSVSASRAKSYFVEELSKGDYYSKDGSREDGQEIIGHWGGKGAEMLGLEGRVDKERFYQLADNINPRTAEKLTPRNAKDRRVGMDFTYSVPKSVSVMAEHGDERIVTAFRESVRETMDEMEQDAQTRVRKGRFWNTTESRTTGNMVYGEFVHRTSRPVDGIPDPHLHAHVFAFNATYDPVEQRWKAADFGATLKRDAPYYEAAFDARMATKLQGLGYAIERTSEKGWEIAGVPDSVADKFSRRTRQIEAIAEERGITSDTLKDGLGKSSRKGKEPGLAMEMLRDIWFNRMLSDKEAEALDRVAQGNGGGDEPRNGPGPSAKEAVDHAVEKSFQNRSVVPEKRLQEAALRFGIGHVTPEQVQAETGREDILKRHYKGQVQCSTKAVLDEEAAMLRQAREGKFAYKPFSDQPITFAPVTEGGKTFELSDDQKGMIAHVLRSKSFVTTVEGDAGSGKTTAMRTVARMIHRSTGQKIQALAPTNAAKDVLRDEGFKGAQTVAMFLESEKLREQARGQVLYVDEAGLMSGRDAARLLKAAKEVDARIVLQGDVKQHASVIRGDSLRLLQKEAGIKPARLSTIQRQKVDSYRDAVSRVAKGDVVGGYDRLDDLGLVREIKGAKRYETLAGDYACEAIENRRTVLVVAPTHAEGAKATSAIRAALKEHGQLGEEREFLHLTNRNLSDADKKDAFAYRRGDVVQVVGPMKGFRRGERLTVMGRDDEHRVVVRRQSAPPPGEYRVPGIAMGAYLPLDKAEHFQVYAESRIQVAVGDKIRVTQNGMTRSKGRISNGVIAEVKGFTQGGTPGDPFSDGNIVLSDGRTLNKDFAHISHGYVTTSHSSQGRTVDTVLIAQSSESLPATNKQQIYVSLSRGRYQARLYTDDKQALRSAIERGSERTSAHELLARGTRLAETKPAASEGLRPHPEQQRQIDYWSRMRTSWATFQSRARETVQQVREQGREIYGKWTARLQQERNPEMTR